MEKVRKTEIFELSQEILPGNTQSCIQIAQLNDVKPNIEYYILRVLVWKCTRKWIMPVLSYAAFVPTGEETCGSKLGNLSQLGV